MKIAAEIKNEVESILCDGNTFDFILRNNIHLYKDKLEELFKDEEFSYNENMSTDFYFECSPIYFKFIGEPIIEEIKHKDLIGIYRYLYVSDFEYNGILSRIHTTNSIKVKLEATVRLFTRNENNLLEFSEPGALYEVPKLIDVLDTFSFEVWRKEEKDKKLLELKKYI